MTSWAPNSRPLILSTNSKIHTILIPLYGHSPLTCSVFRPSSRSSPPRTPTKHNEQHPSQPWDFRRRRGSLHTLRRTQRPRRPLLIILAPRPTRFEGEKCVSSPSTSPRSHVTPEFTISAHGRNRRRGSGAPTLSTKPDAPRHLLSTIATDNSRVFKVRNSILPPRISRILLTSFLN